MDGLLFLSKEERGAVMDEAKQGVTRLAKSRALVCLVCDEHDKNCTQHVHGDLPLEAMDIHLASANYPGPALPDGLKAFYSVPSFPGLLLSPRGTHTATDGSTKYTMCSSCLGSLRATALPKFAVANGFAVGELPPDIADVRQIEVLLCSLIHNRMQLVTVDGIGSKVMKGHCINLAADVSAVKDRLLPRTSADMSLAYKVIVVGARTPEEKINFERYHVARRDKVQALLGHFLADNHLYADISMDETAMENVEGMLGDLTAHMDGDQDVSALQRHFAQAEGYTNVTRAVPLRRTRGRSQQIHEKSTSS